MFSSFQSACVCVCDEEGVGAPLDEHLQQLCKSFLELWDDFSNQHQLLPQLPVHSQQLLAPVRATAGPQVERGWAATRRHVHRSDSAKHQRDI